MNQIIFPEKLDNNRIVYDKELLEIIWFKALEINKSYSLPFIETKLKEIENILYLFRSRN